MSLIKSKNQKNEYKDFYRCKKCLMVSTRPRTNFFNGVCSGCINFAERKKINWKHGFYRNDIGWRIIGKNENN